MFWEDGGGGGGWWWWLLTKGAARLGQVAELDGELHALAVVAGHRADLALDVAAVGVRLRVEGLIGQDGRVRDADGVVGHDLGIAELLLLSVSIQSPMARGC